MFGASQLWGKIGRAFLRALSERQYSKIPSAELNPAISACLKQLAVEKVDLMKGHLDLSKADFVVFTDGSFPDGSKSKGSPSVA